MNATDKQTALIARWHRRVVASGTRLLALACFDNTKFLLKRNAVEDDVISFDQWNLEFTVDIIDNLHDFSFFLRKVIERADAVNLSKRIFPHKEMEKVTIHQGGLDEEKVLLCQKNLWWLLGRVIHSKSVVILGGTQSELIIYGDGKTREYENSQVYVEVESDFDSNKGIKHIIHIPSLVHCYVSSALVHKIEDAVRLNSAV